ncbi:sulfate/molybdate ABC transporter ATP-binding protein [Calidifontibacillus oryziterrae]|uniref:sulfate/molybdate ABC transporter ATP-binding protein n=1 Tax=Calidifontibacillus oryziterrae TaxID=1191699 RepID=UPI0002E627E4|nr:sulfate ABC transporter ATP-binding protein [Calidifontibacillus oryziterrae]
MGVSIKDVTKLFGKYPAVKDINLNIQAGDFVALLGPSGSGKTTLLRLIAGLENVDSGKILFNNIDYTNKTVKERKVGFVFQHYALFKHMTVFENVSFGIKVKSRNLRPTKNEMKERVFDLLKLVQLEHLADRYPSQLSGGQQQRIALARALAVEPDILLLDEPFGALDAKVRQELRHWLRDIHQKFNITTVFVTHDQEEALEMADTIVVMNNGKIEQTGTPEEVYQYPKNSFVYSFLGRTNTFKNNSLEFGKGDSNNQVTEYIRPHEIKLNKSLLKDSWVPSQVSRLQKIGAIIRIELIRLDTDELYEVEMSNEQFRELGALEKSDIVFADFSNIMVFENQH